MTYEQNIRKVSKRLDQAHYNYFLKGVKIKKERAQAKEAIEMQAELIRGFVDYLQTNHVDSSNIDEYLFSQGLIIVS